MLIINGQLKENNQPFDLHGSSVFTTLRYQNNEPLLWERHWQRLSSHAQAFDYKMPHEKEILALLTHLIHDKKTYKIRIIINHENYAITIEPYALPSPLIYEGVKVIYSSIKVHPQLKHYKTTSYLPYIMALKEAQAQGA
jgi:branched-subunit amino acid aminotransferase/4-amino-4-deoxychorismate lyase